jgi:hypothetical protein
MPTDKLIGHNVRWIPERKVSIDRTVPDEALTSRRTLVRSERP